MKNMTDKPPLKIIWNGKFYECPMFSGATFSGKDKAEAKEKALEWFSKHLGATYSGPFFEE